MSGEQSAQSKGKGRAIAADEATETTPLLPGPSSHAQEHRVPARRRLLSVFLVWLSVCILLFVSLALLVYSYAPGEVSSEELLERAVVVAGPDRVNVLNITDNGIWVQVNGRVGIDAGAVIGIHHDEEDNLFRDVWKAFGRWGVRRVDSVGVALSTVQVISSFGEPLASVEIPRLHLPLTANPPADNSWLTLLSIPVFIKPTNDSSVLIKFVRESWRDGHISVRAHVPKADVFTRILHVVRSNIRINLNMKIPLLPGLPSPGRGASLPSFNQLVTLKSFSIKSVEDTLTVRANATAIDPAPAGFILTTPTIPVVISLPGIPPIPIATLDAHPFSLTHPNITVEVSGTVLPLPENAAPALSSFLTAYLSAEDSPISISSPLFAGIAVDALFPAPRPKPQVLKNVTIHEMKIRPLANGTFLASGTVYARVILPKGMDLSINVTAVLPDVMIFDGEVPEGASFPTDPPLPDPLPERAFGRIRPNGWLVSDCEPTYSDKGEEIAFAVSAAIVDVPLQVLPGRQKEFRDFVGKVIFGTQGAIAGILGSSDVAVQVQGLAFGESQAIELHGLPFSGSVRVGKKTLFEGHSWDRWVS